MATRRIKDITNTATTFASDDFIALDGATQGTRKMDKDDLIAEVSAGVSGDYLEEANNLSDVASLDTSKLNMEIPDVGTAPNEVPLSGQLGTMAFQDASGVSVGQLEADQIGIGTSSPSSYYFAANQLVIGDGADNKGMTIASGPGSTGNVVFADTGSTTIGRIQYNHGTNEMKFRVNDSERVTIDSSGRVGIGTDSPSQLLHIKSSDPVIRLEDSSPDGIYAQIDGAGGGLILTADGTSGAASSAIKFRIDGSTAANDKWAIYNSGNLVSLTPGNIEISNGNLIIGTSGKGIDFGSAATSAGDGTGTTGTPANSVLSDYEFGSWTPRFEMTGANFASITMDMIVAQYVKVGRHVHCQAQIRTDALDVTGASGYVAVQGLPFVSDTTSSNHGALLVVWSNIWVNSPNTAYVQPNTTRAVLARLGTTGGSPTTASDMTNGTVANANELIFTISYIAST